MSAKTPEVDALGNIYAHYQLGVKIPVTDRDVDGNVIDISDAPWFFIVPGFRKALAPDPENPTGRLLLITKGELEKHIPKDGVDFLVVDESDPDLPEPRWEAKIKPRGWK